MNRIHVRALCFGLLCLLTLDAWAKQEGELAPGFVNPGYIEHPEWFKNSFLDMREDVEEAAAAGRRVMLYFYQDGCPYCKKLMEVNLSQKDIVDRLKRDFDVIAINIWGDREVTDMDGEQLTEKRYARKLGVQFTPTLIFLDEQGKVVARLNGYYPPHQFRVVLDYVAGHREKDMSLREYYASVSPAKSTGRLHIEPGYLEPPYRLDRRESDRPLIVLFEQKDCSACDELHLDIFRKPEVRKQLDRFDIVLLDMWSDTPVITPDGRQTTARDWARALNVQYAPTMVFFDGDREVFRTEAWLRSFHVESALDYVASKAWKQQPNFQRFIEARADRLRAQGRKIDLLE